MALRALQRLVFSGQLKGSLVMVECPAQGLDAVVAARAVRAKCQPVGKHKSGIFLQMAIAARFLVKLQQAPLDVAIAAAERLAVAQSLMSVQGESQCCVRKAHGVQIRE